MSLSNRIEALQSAYGDLDGAELLSALMGEFPGEIAAVSSFGSESAVLLSLIAKVDRNLPVLFLDTDALFDETLDYRDLLVEQLGLTDVRSIRPDPADLVRADELWRTDADACCDLRKVLPLRRATEPFAALIDGRKRIHGADRTDIPVIGETPNGKISISPLATWSKERIESQFTKSNLPAHPLVAQGYSSIGCWPCTRPTQPGESIRAGRWAGRGKSECGIHVRG